MNEKSTWVKPKLIILVRGTKQENVLSFCKNGIGMQWPGGDWSYQCQTCEGPCKTDPWINPPTPDSELGSS